MHSQGVESRKGNTGIQCSKQSTLSLTKWNEDTSSTRPNRQNVGAGDSVGRHALFQSTFASVF
ncbi:hypothetical protein C8D76_103143 [Pasteurella langaaensis DSM 22999]|uniref:Uncharacterized protein n=1 Tax=Alitibacter langaaensis DSM 22999 TaxID=1122935 RepID=A0A2U0TAC1_9PAST|nr:hypothetical protein C8D76_103143 [Pasteurella langaaensis DSM 22999]